MTKTSSRKTKKNPDFKRIKAKVGKRAVKPANVTDTTFKTASLQVRKQQVGAEAQTTPSDDAIAAATDSATMAVLYSAKGKSLQELTAQLSHPASNVRISAIKGMNAIVNDFPHVFVSRHYYLLFPAVAKCLVDMDLTARQLSRNLLRDVLRQALSPMQRATLRPYIPLLVAYILSALNSLDRPTRMDGSKALIILFEQSKNDDTNDGDYGEGHGENNNAMDCLVDDEDLGRLLPALVGLMSTDPHQQNPSQPQISKSKNSKKSSAMESERCIILQSLISVLKGVSQTRVPARRDQTISPRYNVKNANVSQVKGSSVVLLRRNNITTLQQPRGICMKLTSIADIPPFDDHVESSNTIKTLTRDDATVMLPPSATSELVSKLCDHLVETTQAGGRDDVVGMDQMVRRANNMLGKNAAEELNLVVSAIHLVWKTLGFRGYQKSEELLKGIKQWRQLVALLLEIFPILSQEQQTREDGISLCDRLNLTICTIIMEVSSTLIEFDEEDESSSWMDPTLEYLLPQVEKDGDASRHKASVVHILARLLLLRHNGTFMLAPDIHQTILETLHTFLFGQSDILQLDEDRIRSPAGRRVAQLVRDMVIELCNLDPFTSQTDSALNKRLLAMLLQMPSFLKAWRGDFSSDVYSTIVLLTDVVRRISPDTTDASQQDFLKRIRQDLAQLFTSTVEHATAGTLSEKRKRRIALGSAEGWRSIFEQYPAPTQRELMGLLGLLQSPTAETLSGLGIICARGGRTVGDSSTLSPEVEEFVGQILHGIRRSLPMPSYLGFLIQSTGIVSATNIDFKPPMLTEDKGEVKPERAGIQGVNLGWTSDDSKFILSFDRKLRRTSWYLTDCGNAFKILPMLHPILISWLDVATADATPKLFTLRARSAIAILAWIARDMQISCDQSAIFVILPEIEQLVVTAICRLLETVPTGEADNEDDDSSRSAASFLRPVMVLIRKEPSLLKLIFSEHLVLLRNDASKALQSSVPLEMLLLIVRDPVTREALTSVRQDVVEIALSIEKEATGGPFESASRRLRTYLEAFR